MDEGKKNTIIAIAIGAIMIVIIIVMIASSKNNKQQSLGNVAQNNEQNNNTTQETVSEIDAKELAKAMDFINTLPMQLNFLNCYFEDASQLTEEQRLQLALAYAYKNNNGKQGEGETEKYEIKAEELKIEKIVGKNLEFKQKEVTVFMENVGQKKITYQSGTYTFENTPGMILPERNYARLIKANMKDDTYYVCLKQGYIAQTVNGAKDVADIETTDIVEYSLKQYTDNSVIFSYKNEASQVIETYNFENALQSNYSSFSNKMKTYEYGLKKRADGSFYLVSFRVV